MTAGLATTLVPPFPRIAVEHGGAGPLVLFLHGVGGNRSNWRPQLAALASRFHVAAWDARGYGDSDDAPGGLSMADFSADVLRVLDRFGADRAHLVGLSMGGLIAQDFAHRHPDRVRSLVLADTGTGLRDGQDDRWVEPFLRARREPLLAGRTPAEIAPELARSLLSPAAPAEAVGQAVASLAAVRTRSYLAALEAVTRYRMVLDHARVAAPVLVLVGAEDSLTPPRVARDLAARIPGARLAVIEGAGHLSNVERPGAFGALLLEFLCGQR